MPAPAFAFALADRPFFGLFCLEAVALASDRDVDVAFDLGAEAFVFGAEVVALGAEVFVFGAEAFGMGFAATDFEVLGLGVGFRSFAGLALLARDVMGACSATWGLSATSAERYRCYHVGCARSLHELRGTDDTAGRRPDVSL